eukprot:TRINITY_DN81096_c0_g1_i1.p1 TRINITY_DN81096_c0_g1~~TRINITY_DN81096_c0_g1_i1.p1  ORF type:complete len:275 (+),score=10.84 TRINITY_DN81096_c0_g1_i1:99-827(+)
MKTLADDPSKSYTASEIRDELWEKFQVDTSVGNVHYHLKKTHGYSWKRNHFKPPSAFTNGQRVLDFQVSKALLSYIKEGKNVFFIDETSFSLGTHAEYSFSKRGVPPYRIGYKKAQAYNLIMAVTSKQVYAYQIRTESNNEVTFASFIIELSKKIMSMERKYISKVVLFLDNVSFHKSEFVLELFGLLPFPILFSSPNNSDLNCIENCFGLVKTEIKKLRNTSKQGFTVEHILQFFVTEAFT